MTPSRKTALSLPGRGGWEQVSPPEWSQVRGTVAHLRGRLPKAGSGDTSQAPPRTNGPRESDLGGTGGERPFLPTSPPDHHPSGCHGARVVEATPRQAFLFQEEAPGP